MEPLFSITQSIAATPALTRTPAGICCHLRGPAFITSGSPKLTGKLGADNQKASIWNYSNTNWLREKKKKKLAIPFRLPREKRWGESFVFWKAVLFWGEIIYLSPVNNCISRVTSICEPRLLHQDLTPGTHWGRSLSRAAKRRRSHLAVFPGLKPQPLALRAVGRVRADARALRACLVPALCRHRAGNREAKTSCKCPFQLSLIGCGLSIRHFMKTLKSVPAALLHGQTGDDLSHRLRRDGPPHCHNQPSSITAFSVDAERLKCS